MTIKLGEAICFTNYNPYSRFHMAMGFFNPIFSLPPLNEVGGRERRSFASTHHSHMKMDMFYLDFPLPNSPTTFTPIICILHNIPPTPGPPLPSTNPYEAEYWVRHTYILSNFPLTWWVKHQGTFTPYVG